MGKLIAAINMTLDGFCDHTAGIADEELHQHYKELLQNAGSVLYGRITYQLMESYWPSLVENPTGDPSLDDFAIAIDNVPKIVFSRTLSSVDWKQTLLKKEIIREEIAELKEKADKNIYAGSPGIIVALTQLGLIDEYQLCIHPVILGKGLPLFRDIRETLDLKLTGTKTFGSGVVCLYYAYASK